MAGASSHEVIDLELFRGKAGLGFNIRGGTDIPHVKGNTGIFITKIRENGAAAEDGTLKEGDKIIEINGTDVMAVTHTTAVNLFLTAGNSVKLKIIKGEEQRIKAQILQDEMAKMEKTVENSALESLKDESSSSLLGATSIVLGLLVVGAGAYFGYKFLKSRN